MIIAGVIAGLICLIVGVLGILGDRLGDRHPAIRKFLCLATPTTPPEIIEKRRQSNKKAGYFSLIFGGLLFLFSIFVDWILTLI